MSWRDGCAPRPPVADGAAVVEFDFALADEVGARIAGVADSARDLLSAGAAARPLLAAWSGAHRRAHDDESARLARTVSAGAESLAADLARLRAAWDDAAALQRAANEAAG